MKNKLLNIRVSEQQLATLKKIANKYFEGNVSKLIIAACLVFKGGKDGRNN